jgi:hypothetical protein
MQKMAVKQARYRAEAVRSKGDLRLKDAGLAIEQGKVEIERAPSELVCQQRGIPFQVIVWPQGYPPGGVPMHLATASQVMVNMRREMMVVRMIGSGIRRKEVSRKVDVCIIVCFMAYSR